MGYSSFELSGSAGIKVISAFEKMEIYFIFHTPTQLPTQNKNYRQVQGKHVERHRGPNGVFC